MSDETSKFFGSNYLELAEAIADLMSLSSELIELLALEAEPGGETIDEGNGLYLVEVSSGVVSLRAVEEREVPYCDDGPVAATFIVTPE